MSAATEGFSAMISDLDMRRAARRAADSTEGEAGGARTVLSQHGPTRERAPVRVRAQRARARARARRRPRSRQSMRCQIPPGSGATRPSISSSVNVATIVGNRKPRPRGERVDVRGIVAERAHDCAHRGTRRCALRGIGAAGALAAGKIAELVEDVLRRLDELRAFADELVRALRERRMDRARAARRPRAPARRRGAR